MQTLIISFSSISICCLLIATWVCHFQCPWLTFSAGVIPSVLSPHCLPHLIWSALLGGIPVEQPYGLQPFHRSTELWLSETASVIWSEMFRFRDGELHTQIGSLLEQRCRNKNKTGGDSFHYGKADKFLWLLLSKLNSSAWPRKIIPLFEISIWYFAIQLNFSAFLDRLQLLLSFLNVALWEREGLCSLLFSLRLYSGSAKINLEECLMVQLPCICCATSPAITVPSLK